VYAALVGAAVVSIASSAVAQEKPATFGGDITAEEASPLPPVVVEGPLRPVSKPQRKAAKRRPASTSPQVSAAAAGEGSGGGDADYGAVEGATDGVGNGGDPVGVFTLGQLDTIGGSTITNEAMWTYNKNSLDQAVSILPGVTMHNTGGSRNERDIYVRGFDRFRVPLSIDGVRVYLPADNRLDFNRFLTPDLAEIQVQKGYVSVLNGPGGMGGAINLVSRKPTKAVELEGRSGAVFNGDLNSLNSWNSYAFAGTRQEKYYAQISGTIVDQDHWNLSDDFTPVNLTNEDGGARDNSYTRDWRINVKAGYTPNATDEYSLSFTHQSGEKSAPLHVEGQRIQPRYWNWPYWDLESTTWLSKTQIGEASYIKTNAYYNTFQNLLSSFNDATYSNQPRPQDFNSYYDDFAYGGSLEFGTNLIPMNTFKAAIHYRRDNHAERSDVAPDGATVHEPWQHNVEDTWSFAVENTFHATRRLDFVTGVSYDMNMVREAEDYDSDTDEITRSPTPNVDAWNGQGALVYSLSDTGKVHASVSSRTRFPTVFDRYSTRFGTRAANPYLKPERATNYEIGWSDKIGRNAQLSTAVFYSDLNDSIQNVYVGSSGSSAILGVNADGHTYGFEISGDWDITPSLRIGANYTYLERELDYASGASGLTPAQQTALAAAHPEGTPRHEAFIYLAWKATERLTLTPNLELASDRSSLITSAESTLPSGIPNYVKAGSYALVNFQAEYRLTENVTAAFGATNLLDDNYSLVEGFPEAGRQFFTNVKARF
jgi:iron complex outermembrane receptor protein